MNVNINLKIIDNLEYIKKYLIYLYRKCNRLLFILN